MSSKKYSIQKGLIYQKIKGKIVIFDGEESEIYTLNSTASYIFERIKLGKTPNSIVDDLVKRYNVPQELAKKDVEKLIYELQVKKIIGS